MTIRHLFSALLLTAAAAPAVAQEAESTQSIPTAAPAAATRQQDLSLFAQGGGPLEDRSSISRQASIQGLVYRRAMRKHPGTHWKAGLGIGTSSYTSLQYLAPPTSDTVRNILYNNYERVIVATGGIDGERQLWRGIYLTAGLEIQAGGSGGYVDSVTQTSYQFGTQWQATTSTAARFADTRHYFGTGLGVLGIRAYSRRFTAAVDVFTGVCAGMISQTLTTGRPDVMSRYSIFDFSAGGLGSRISVGYRF